MALLPLRITVFHLAGTWYEELEAALLQWALVSLQHSSYQSLHSVRTVLRLCCGAVKVGRPPVVHGADLDRNRGSTLTCSAQSKKLQRQEDRKERTRGAAVISFIVRDLQIQSNLQTNLPQNLQSLDKNLQNKTRGRWQTLCYS